MRFAELAADGRFATDHSYFEVAGAIEALSAALANAEATGMPRQEMREAIKVAREAHAESPFVRRCQSWPRGYPGDFETVEYLLSRENRAETGTLGYMIERYTLASNIVHQHRNKLLRQAAEIRRSVLRKQERGNPAILVLASNSSYDLRCIADSVASRDFRVVLNDSDPDALAFSLKELTPIKDRLVAVKGHAVRCAHQIKDSGPYDLVVAGGLFDYLNDKWAKKLIALVVNEWLAPGGRFFFTNMSTGNPHRLWMGCVADWNLIERTEEDLALLVSSAEPRAAAVKFRVTRDPTSLALLAEVDLVQNWCGMSGRQPGPS